MSEEVKENQVRIELLKPMAAPPYNGVPGDVLVVPESLANALLESEAAKHLPDPKVAEAIAEAEVLDPDAEKRIDENLKGVDELFAKQLGDAAAEPVEAEAAPVVEEKKGKRK